MAGEPPKGLDSVEGKIDMFDAEHHGDAINTEASITAEEERAVVRKIDMVVLPLMCFVFFLQYLDKQSLSYAAVSCATTSNRIVS